MTDVTTLRILRRIHSYFEDVHSDRLSLPSAKIPSSERTNIITVISPKVVAKKSKYAVGDEPRNAFSAAHR